MAKKVIPVIPVIPVKKDEDEETHPQSREVISNKAALYLIVVLLILAGVAIYYGKYDTPKNPQTAKVWEYQTERFWDRGKFDSGPANNAVVGENFISFSYNGSGTNVIINCIRTNRQGSRLICNYASRDGRLMSGGVWLKKKNDYLYEGFIEEIIWEKKKYKNIKISLARR